MSSSSTIVNKLSLARKQNNPSMNNFTRSKFFGYSLEVGSSHALGMTKNSLENLTVNDSRGQAEGDAEVQQQLVEMVRMQLREVEIGEISHTGAERMKRMVRDVLEKEDRISSRKIKDLKDFAEEVGVKNIGYF